MAEEEQSGCGVIVAGIGVIALIAMITNNWGTIWPWVQGSIALGIMGLIGYILYRCRRPIAKLIREQCERAAESQALRDLEDKRTAAAQAVERYYDRHAVQLRSEIQRDELERDVRRNLRHLTADRDIADWEEEWLTRLRRIVSGLEREEQREGPNERTAARERVRLHFLKHREVLRDRDFDGARLTYESLERQIGLYLGDRVPMQAVGAEAQRLIDIIDRLVIQAGVRDCYDEHRELIADSDFHAFYANFLQDQLDLKGSRPVEEFQRAANKLKQLIREAASAGRPHAVVEREKQLWDEINAKRGDQWTHEQKNQWVAGRLNAYMIQQGYKPQ